MEGKNHFKIMLILMIINQRITNCFKYDRNAIEEIAEEIEKSVDDVKKYAKVFWERYKELSSMCDFPLF